MKLVWLKLLVIVILLGGSWAFYSFGSKEISFEVPSAVSFEELAEKVKSQKSKVLERVEPSQADAQAETSEVVSIESEVSDPDATSQLPTSDFSSTDLPEEDRKSVV